jgi:integrase
MFRENLDIQKPKSVPTLDQIWESYLPWAKQHKKTWKNDEYHYGKHLKPRFGDKRLDSISPMAVEGMKLELRQSLNRQGKPYTNATIKHQLVLLNRLYSIARKWGQFTGQNPLDQVEKPKLDNQKTESLDNEEIKALAKVLENWPCRESAAFVEFALLTGFRRSDLFRLTWEAVDLAQGRVTLKSKGGKTFTVPISKEALAVLKSLKQTDCYVFPGKNAQQRTDFKGPWLKIRKAAGLPSDFRFHGLRHNFASHLVSNGEDLYTVGKLLGHRNTSTTQRYAHLADERLRQAALKSGRLVKPGAETGKRPD